MEKDVLVILMIAFGLFAIIMFVLFYVYLKRFYNNKHIDDNYENDIDNEPDEDIIGNSGVDENNSSDSMNFEEEKNDLNASLYDDEEFLPVRKDK